MGDELKSAYELAMEKLARQEGGSDAPLELSDDQKHAIAEIRQEYRAKLAERQILYHSESRQTMGDPEVLERLEADYRRDREHLESRCEARIQAIREGKKP